MSNERPDKFLSWRGPLAEPDALPEQGLDDKEAAWLRLQARLGSSRPAKVFAERSRRRLYWYGLAAACLLLALIPAARLYRTRPVPAGNRGPDLVRQQATTTGRESAPLVIINRAVTSKKISPAPLRRTAGRPQQAATPTPREQQPATAAPQDQEIATTTPRAQAEAGTSPDSAGRMASRTAPVKKTLRVVSINEIDNPGSSGPAMTIRGTSAPFRVRLIPRQ